MLQDVVAEPYGTDPKAETAPAPPVAPLDAAGCGHDC